MEIELSFSVDILAAQKEMVKAPNKNLPSHTSHNTYPLDHAKP